jgi:kynurenine formamidase
MLAGARLVDLSQPLGPDTVLWADSSPVQATVLGDHERHGAYWRDVSFPEHAGTHMDAPLHFAADGDAADRIPLERLVVPAVRLDVRVLCGGDPAFTLSAAQVEGIEEAEGRIPAGSAVLVHTGWDAHVADQDRYADFPGIGPDAAELLVERGIAGVGIDTLGVDPAYADEFPAHRVTQPAGVWHLEGLVDLEAVPTRGAWLVAAPLPLVDGSGSPVRAFAIVPG